ncbi:hypothetical protein X772_31485 [Mesorhizobium sp. LSJC280B00]|nr:hypothetical protein X772_31485 [Mesorhizobium sp. LSJC280B00]
MSVRDLILSTLADQVGACAAALKLVHALIETHVLAAERFHGDDTTVPILARGKTDTGRIWTYLRDDRPFGGQSPPAALYYASRDRRQEYPERHLKLWRILQAGAYRPIAATIRSSTQIVAPVPLTQSSRGRTHCNGGVVTLVRALSTGLNCSHFA